MGVLNFRKMFLFCAHAMDLRYIIYKYLDMGTGSAGDDSSSFGQSEKGKMAYTPQHIANYFLMRADKEGRNITQMKLQKLVYIAYGWYLSVMGASLFREPIQAWDHGPVIPSIYHEFKHFRSDPITERATSYDMDLDEEYEPCVDPDNYDSDLILNYVWNSYKKYSGAALRRKTHEPDTPWSAVFDPKRRGVELKDDDIRIHFNQKIEEYLDTD